MPKKKLKLSQRKQSEQFIKKARELGADETGKAFEAAVNKVIPARGLKKTGNRVGVNCFGA